MEPTGEMAWQLRVLPALVEHPSLCLPLIAHNTHNSLALEDQTPSSILHKHIHTIKDKSFLKRIFGAGKMAQWLKLATQASEIELIPKCQVVMVGQLRISTSENGVGGNPDQAH